MAEWVELALELGDVLVHGGPVERNEASGKRVESSPSMGGGRVAVAASDLAGPATVPPRR